jgi:hypothetical protein
MSIFAVIRDASEVNNPALGTRIAKQFPGAFYNVGKGQWLISSDLGVKEVSAALNIEKGGKFTGTLVMEVTSYYGLHNKKLWNWISEHGGEHDDE